MAPPKKIKLDNKDMVWWLLSACAADVIHDCNKTRLEETFDQMHTVLTDLERATQKGGSLRGRYKKQRGGGREDAKHALRQAFPYLITLSIEYIQKILLLFALEFPTVELARKHVAHAKEEKKFGEQYTGGRLVKARIPPPKPPPLPPTLSHEVFSHFIDKFKIADAGGGDDGGGGGDGPPVKRARREPDNQNEMEIATSAMQTFSHIVGEPDESSGWRSAQYNYILEEFFEIMFIESGSILPITPLNTPNAATAANNKLEKMCFKLSDPDTMWDVWGVRGCIMKTLIKFLITEFLKTKKEPINELFGLEPGQEHLSNIVDNKLKTSKNEKQLKDLYKLIYLKAEEEEEGGGGGNMPPAVEDDIFHGMVANPEAVRGQLVRAPDLDLTPFTEGLWEEPPPPHVTGRAYMGQVAVPFSISQAMEEDDGAEMEEEAEELEEKIGSPRRAPKPPAQAAPTPVAGPARGSPPGSAHSAGTAMSSPRPASQGSSTDSPGAAAASPPSSTIPTLASTDARYTQQSESQYKNNQGGGGRIIQSGGGKQLKSTVEAMKAQGEELLDSIVKNPIAPADKFFKKYIDKLSNKNAFLKLCDMVSMSDLKYAEPWIKNTMPNRRVEGYNKKMNNFVDKIKERVRVCIETLEAFDNSKSKKKLGRDEKHLANRIHRKIAEMVLLWTGLIVRNDEKSFKLTPEGENQCQNERNKIMIDNLLQMVNTGKPTPSTLDRKVFASIKTIHAQKPGVKQNYTGDDFFKKLKGWIDSKAGDEKRCCIANAVSEIAEKMEDYIFCPTGSILDCGSGGGAGFGQCTAKQELGKSKKKAARGMEWGNEEVYFENDDDMIYHYVGKYTPRDGSALLGKKDMSLQVTLPRKTIFVNLKKVDIMKSKDLVLSNVYFGHALSELVKGVKSEGIIIEGTENYFNFLEKLFPLVNDTIMLNFFKKVLRKSLGDIVQGFNAIIKDGMYKGPGGLGAYGVDKGIIKHTFKNAENAIRVGVANDQPEASRAGFMYSVLKETDKNPQAIVGFWGPKSREGRPPNPQQVFVWGPPDFFIHKGGGSRKKTQKRRRRKKRKSRRKRRRKKRTKKKRRRNRGKTRRKKS